MPQPPIAPPPPSGHGPAILSLVLAVLGGAISVLLLREHLAVFEGDVAGGLFCADAGRFDCNAVAAHPAAWLLGYPLPLWGLLFYLAMAALATCALALPAGERAAAVAIGAVLAFTAVLLDAYLGVVMVARIGSICLNCLATYVLNVGLALTFWRLDRTAGAHPAWRGLAAAWRPLATRSAPAPAESATGARGAIALAPAGAKLAIAVVALACGTTAFALTARSVGETLAVARDEAVDFLSRFGSEPAVDMARFAGLPGEGPTDARVNIVVAGDFDCNFCRALAARLRELRARHPRDIRVVFLNAPISSRCNPIIRRDLHPESCWLAKAAICADEHGRFWEYHDLLYRQIPLPRVARSTVLERIATIGLPADGLERCVASAGADSALAHQVKLWSDLGMKSVPSLVINGHVKTGGIYPTTLRAIVGALLAPGS